MLAHFIPGDQVLDFLAPHKDWLDVRFCAENDDKTFQRELPETEVLWHVLRPISGDDLQRALRLRLVHKMGAGVNTIDVDTATRLGILVANMPGPIPRPWPRARSCSCSRRCAGCSNSTSTRARERAGPPIPPWGDGA